MKVAKLRAHGCGPALWPGRMCCGGQAHGWSAEQNSINLEFLKESPLDSFLCEASECHLSVTHTPFYSLSIVQPCPHLTSVCVPFCACLQVSKPLRERGSWCSKAGPGPVLSLIPDFSGCSCLGSKETVKGTCGDFWGLWISCLTGSIPACLRLSAPSTGTFLSQNSMKREKEEREHSRTKQ